MRVDTDVRSLKVSVKGIEYTWCGGFGAVITSKERGRKVGDLRYIGETIFKVYAIYGTIFLRRVCWIPVENIDAEWIRKFKAELFGIPLYLFTCPEGHSIEI